MYNVCAPISEALAEIPCIEHQNVFSRFYQVGRNLGLVAVREQKHGSHRQICWAYLVPPECSGPGDEERLSGCRPYHLSVKRSKCMRRTLSTGHELNGLRFAPCHANAFSKDCGEIRRHVRGRWMRVGIEDLWVRCFGMWEAQNWGDQTKRTSSVTSMGPGML